MLFRYNELGEAITAQHLRELRDANRASRHAYYDRRYAMYRGIATDPREPDYDETKCLQFFPKGQDETLDEYRERLKLWVPQGRLIIERLTDMVFKGGVEFSFKPLNDSDSAMAERATEIVAADLKYNDWESAARDRVLEPLAIGQISDWLDYRRHDPFTGKAFDNGGRVRFIKRWPWFAEPVVHPDNVTEIIGAAYIYNLENMVVSPSVSLYMGLDGQTALVTEFWLNPCYDTDTGAIKHPGGFLRLENERVKMPTGREGWERENPYGLVPVVFWQSPDSDESQYNSEAFVDRYVDAWLKLCRTWSNAASGIQYIINQRAIVAADEAMPKTLPTRHNSVLKLGSGTPPSTVENMPRNLDNSPEAELAQYLTGVIGEAGCYSASLMSLDGVGKLAESGIAMKITYEATVDCVRMLRRNYARSLKELGTKTLAVKLYENGGKLDGIDLSKLEAAVSFDDNIMPVDELAALEYDLLLIQSGLKKKAVVIRQHNPELKTDEDVERFMQEVQAETPKKEPVTPLGLRAKNRENRNPDAEDKRPE